MECENLDGSPYFQILGSVDENEIAGSDDEDEAKTPKESKESVALINWSEARINQLVVSQREISKIGKPCQVQEYAELQHRSHAGDFSHAKNDLRLLLLDFEQEKLVIEVGGKFQGLPKPISEFILICKEVDMDIKSVRTPELIGSQVYMFPILSVQKRLNSQLVTPYLVITQRAASKTRTTN